MNRAQSDSRSRSRHASLDHNHGRQQFDDLEETAFLDLSRTRSHELSVAESVAVGDPAPDEFKASIDSDDDSTTAPQWPPSTKYLVLLCGFLTSTSFGVTQVPILYVFRLMTCDIYYENHPGQVPVSASESALPNTFGSLLYHAVTSLSQYPVLATRGDRCAVHSIESSTALNISLLGASTTVFGIMNLFLTGSLVKSIGLKRTLVIQVGFPAVRLFIQNIGVEVWGSAGIIIVQCSQIASIIGGPSGYILVLNAFMTEVVEYEERTAALGRVAGSTMFGSALGFLIGGIVAEDFGIRAPFRLTLALFVFASAYVAIFLPYIPPPEAKTAQEELNGKPKQSAVRRFFAPLMVFTPKKFISRNGEAQTEYGVFLLASGVFLAILATGYLATLLQLYATDVFNFGTKANGALIFIYSLLRGVFLTFAFPNLIAIGRRLTKKLEVDSQQSEGLDEREASERDPLLTMNGSTSSSSASPPVQKKDQTFLFDLIYTRFSLLADGLLTLLCTFVHQGWQMYLVAAILPFAAGTGSAAKGTVLQMVGSSATSSERTDALAGLSLVENMARLSTTFVFGVIFAAFASIGRTDLVFTCNAAIALLGFMVLLLARFPPEGSRRLDQVELDSSDD